MEQWLHSFSSVEYIMSFANQLVFGLSVLVIVCIELKDYRKERRDKN